MNERGIDPFQHSRIPRLLFGAGKIAELPELVRSQHWSRIAIITGGRSFPEGDAAGRLRAALDDLSIAFSEHQCGGEPSPALVDRMVEELRGRDPEAIVSIGGGSVLDAGKAVSAAMRMPGSVRDYLEGVGTKKPGGEKLPFIACPSTAGTGSEATKNAVLSEVGTNGFKKSLRHEAFVPDIALIDPELGLGAPRQVTASSGLDAITQLLEAYVSREATPFTDAVAASGLEAAGRSFERLLQAPNDLPARSQMAYAAYCSGICLANAGLGVVHGAASPAGALTPVPHGLFCGALLGPSVRLTLSRLRAVLAESESAEAHRALGKYADAGRCLSGGARSGAADGAELSGAAEAGDSSTLEEQLQRLTEAAMLPGLSRYGFNEEVIRRIAEGSGMKNHPVSLSPEEIAEAIKEAV